MGKPTGFLDFARLDEQKEDAASRVTHFREFERPLPLLAARDQGARCMSCGVPFCHTGCPLGNRIPDWNDQVYKDRWEAALAALHATNNFPEITGRICPAPCEEACVVHLHDQPVAIKSIERRIADQAIESGLAYRPFHPRRRSGRRVAIVGSGPAGLACAQQLCRAGHEVTVFERADRPGGLLRYGIPDFKLDKSLVEGRIAQLQAEGVHFRTGVELGRTLSLTELRQENDAVVLATGATQARELAIPGRELAGVHLAMDYLTQQNRRVAGDPVTNPISAHGRHVVILGGGDTGSDCLGTAHRQGAASVTQLELLPRPPLRSGPGSPTWPLWPRVYRVSSSQEEGGQREFAALTRRLVSRDGSCVHSIEVVEVEWTADGPRECPGTTRELPADLVLLALGFTGPEPAAWSGASLATTANGTVLADPTQFATSLPGVFACGDARRGQSLVVWAIWEGREAAHCVDSYLMGQSDLPRVPYAYAP